MKEEEFLTIVDFFLVNEQALLDTFKSAWTKMMIADRFKNNYVNECTFTVIREPELIVWDRQSKPLFQVEVAFEEVSEAETKVTFRQKFETVEECEKIRKYTVGKNDENFDKLEVVLSKM